MKLAPVFLSILMTFKHLKGILTLQTQPSQREGQGTTTVCSGSPVCFEAWSLYLSLISVDSALCTGSLACFFLGVPLGPHVPSPGTHPPDQSCLDSSYWAVSWLFHAFLPCLPVERKTSYSFPRIIPIFSLPCLCNWGEGLTLVETHGCHVSHSFLSRTSHHPWAFHTPQKLVRRSLYSEL